MRVAPGAEVIVNADADQLEQLLINLLRNGRIEFDKPTAETSIEELTRIVATEYRVARA